MDKKNTKSRIWDAPWKYSESFVIIFTMIVLGFALEFFSEQKMASPQFPSNIYILSGFIGFIILLYFILKQTSNTLLFNWLKSPFLAISSISGILFLVILMGSFTQDLPSSNHLVNSLGLNNIAFSYPFVISLLFFLSNLIFIIIHRLNKFSVRNFLFAINHVGIFILAIALMFSVGDIQKHTVRVDKDNYLHNLEGEALPFALRLQDFSIDFFTPKMAIVDNRTDEVINTNQVLISVDTDSILEFAGYQISVKQYIPKSVKQGDKYYFVNDVGFAPSALVEIIDKDKNISEEWISCGSFVYPSEFAEVDSNYTLVMLDPESKKFQSKIGVYYPDNTRESILLEVNRPITIGDWDIYQTDYDKEMGTWSDYSIIEMVRDPWLPVVYLGIFMLIIGAFLLMFIGKNEEK